MKEKKYLLTRVQIFNWFGLGIIVGMLLAVLLIEFAK